MSTHDICFHGEIRKIENIYLPGAMYVDVQGALQYHCMYRQEDLLLHKTSCTYICSLKMIFELKSQMLTYCTYGIHCTNSTYNK